MDEFLKNLYSHLVSDNTLINLLGNKPDKGIYPVNTDSVEDYPCVIYKLIDSTEYAVPKNAQENVIELKIISRKSKKHVEQISTRIRFLLFEWAKDNPRIFNSIKNTEFDDYEPDRRLFIKIIRFTIWTKINP